MQQQPMATPGVHSEAIALSAWPVQHRLAALVLASLLLLAPACAAPG
jgi:hypothetical protein